MMRYSETMKKGYTDAMAVLKCSVCGGTNIHEPKCTNSQLKLPGFDDKMKSHDTAFRNKPRTQKNKNR